MDDQTILVKNLPGRGVVIWLGDTRFLPEYVIQKFARFVLWSYLLVIPFAVVMGVCIGKLV